MNLSRHAPKSRILPLAALLALLCAGCAKTAQEAPVHQAAPPPVAAPAPAPLPSVPPPPPPPQRVRIIAGGDVTLGYHLPEYFDELRDRGPVTEEELIRYPFAEIRALTDQADVFWVNLEGTFTTSEQRVEKNFTFKADPASVGILTDAGVDVVSLANNHAFDFGEEGLLETLATLEHAGVHSYGAGVDLADARRPAIVEKNGLRIGFLGYIYLGEHSIEPETLYAAPGKPGLAGTHGDEATLTRWLQEDIAALRPRVDLVLVSFHWGRESTHIATEYQRRLARVAAEAGADLLVGHHPHVLQGYEVIGKMPVAYSLGNFVFAGNWNPRNKDTALLDITFEVAADGGKRAVTRFIPVSVDRQPDRPFQPWPYGEADAKRVMDLIACYSTEREEEACHPPRPGVPK